MHLTNATEVVWSRASLLNSRSLYPTERVSAYFDQPIHHYTIYCVTIACIAADHASFILLEREGEREI